MSVGLCVCLFVRERQAGTQGKPAATPKQTNTETKANTLTRKTSKLEDLERVLAVAIHAQCQRLQPIQRQPRRHGSHAGAEVPQARGMLEDGERHGPELVREHVVVVPRLHVHVGVWG